MNNPSEAKVAFSDDRYRVMSQLGRGGMGVVYKCLDVKLNTEVAVKVVSFTFSNSEVARFQKEAKALAKLNHPNILTVRDFGSSNDGTLFLVTDIVHGEGLDSVIEDGGAVPLEGSIPMFLQICDGLAHAHKHGILHRDLKPSNIMIAATGKEDDPHIVKLMDFGLAKLQVDDQRLTKTGATVGSPAYMSPEQADGKPTDERSDIYSLGCLMYETLTGEQPFVAANVPATMLMQINKPAPKLVDKLPDMIFPVDLEALIAKCLAKKKEDRYADVGALRNALAEVDEKLRATNLIYQSGAIGLSGVYRGGLKPGGILKTGGHKVKRMSHRMVAGIVTISGLILAGFFLFTVQTLGVFQPPKAMQKISNPAVDNDKAFSFGREDGYIVTASDLKKPGVGIADKPREGEQDDWVKVDDRETDQKLSQLFGLKQIDYLDLSDSHLTDAGLITLAKEPIKGLRLARTRISDKGLAALREMHTLQELSLKGCWNITDDGFKNLVGMKALEFLDISDTKISDKVLYYLGGLKQLRALVAANCKNITGSGFGELNSTMLNTLSIPNSGIKSVNFENLRRVQLLAMIDLENNDLTDKDLDYAHNLAFVCSINLSNNPKLTDVGLMKLLKMECVHTIKLVGCKRITKLGVSKFMVARTGTMVIWDNK